MKTLQDYIDKLNALNFKEMYEGDFFLTWEKTDDELMAGKNAGEQIRDCRQAAHISDEEKEEHKGQKKPVIGLPEQRTVDQKEDDERGGEDELPGEETQNAAHAEKKQEDIAAQLFPLHRRKIGENGR